MNALWLARRDLGSRRGRVALTAVLVAAGVALVVAAELLSRARDQAVAMRVDGIAPQLRVVPEGVSASALARLDLGGTVLPRGTAARATEILGGFARVVEEELIVEEPVSGTTVPVIGVPPERLALGPGEAAPGALLAQRPGFAAPATVLVRGNPHRIGAAIAPTASAEDLALLVPLADLRAALGTPDAASGLRVFLVPGASAGDAEARLRSGLDGQNVIRVDRGAVADRELQGLLARYRVLLYAITAAVVGGCLLVALHLDARERRLELATLVAIGATPALLLRMLTLRAALVGAAGGVAGAAAGLGVAAAWAQSQGSLGPALGVLLLGIGGAAALAAVAALPTALQCALRDPVAGLHEGAA